MDVTPSTVLFLCTGNYYRSRFAEEYFNHHAVRLGLAWRAGSKGFARDMAATGNAGPMAPSAVAALRGHGISPVGAGRFPVPVQVEDFETHHRVILLSRSEHWPMMERLFPGHLARVDCFDIEDIHLEPVTSALPRLAVRVDTLVAELRA